MQVAGWTHCMLPTAAKGAGVHFEPEDNAFPDFEKPTKLKEQDYDGTGTVSTIAPSGTESMATWSEASMSIGTATFFQEKATMSFRPSEVIKESQDEMTPSALPSLGSKLHGTGDCRPCAWFHKPQGCANGKDCRHCHVCTEGEIKARKKSKVNGLRVQDSIRDSSKVSVDEAANGTTSALIDAPPGLNTLEQNAESSSLPSVGSLLHASGTCKPCAWFYKPGGCSNGAECRHCHLCPEGELKSRKKDKVTSLRQDSKRTHEVSGLAIDMDMDVAAAQWNGMGYDFSPLSPAMDMDMSPYAMAGMQPFVAPPMFFPGTSLGSALHGTGMCRPCAWFWKAQGCANGENCFHCHLCPEGEIAQRKKDKLAVMRLLENAETMQRTGPDRKASKSAKTSEPPKVDKSHRSLTKRSTSDSLTELSFEKVDIKGDDMPLGSKVSRASKDSLPASIELESQRVSELATTETVISAAIERKDAAEMPMSVPLPSDAASDLPSVGSALHALGKCKPCAWFHKPQGCANGNGCLHCHICDETELKNRRSAKVNSLKASSNSSRGLQ